MHPTSSSMPSFQLPLETQSEIDKGHAAAHSVPETPSTSGTQDVDFTLQVRWWSESNTQTKVNRLALSRIKSAACLKGVCKSLVSTAFPEDTRPDYMSSEDYYTFTPDEEFLSTPGAIARTEFKFSVQCDGWEYIVLHRELGALRDPDRNMFVTVIEFESQAMMIGALGLTVSLISYPLVFIKKTFLDDAIKQVQHNPDFKGILN